MADLLSHVLVPYVALTATGWWVDWLTPRWVVVGMGGAAIPDLVKVGIVVDPSVVEGLLGIPFRFDPLSTLGGVVVVAGAITLLFEEARGRVLGLLLFGGFSALVVDGMRIYADGRADFWLYPIWWRPPTPSLYSTSDPAVLFVSVGTALLVFLVDRYVAS